MSTNSDVLINLSTFIENILVHDDVIISTNALTLVTIDQLCTSIVTYSRRLIIIK